MCPQKYYAMINSENQRETVREQMVEYAREHSISAAARAYDTTRDTVRKWVRRHQQGEPLCDRSRRPHSSPNKTDPEIEQKVVAAAKKTEYGPHRLSDWLRNNEGIEISPWTVRNIRYRHGLVRQTTRRNTCYPAHWAWEGDGEPFSLVQADVKDVHDKKLWAPSGPLTWPAWGFPATSGLSWKNRAGCAFWPIAGG